MIIKVSAELRLLTASDWTVSLNSSWIKSFTPSADNAHSLHQGQEQTFSDFVEEVWSLGFFRSLSAPRPWFPRPWFFGSSPLSCSLSEQDLPLPLPPRHHCRASTSAPGSAGQILGIDVTDDVAWMRNESPVHLSDTDRDYNSNIVNINLVLNEMI